MSELLNKIVILGDTCVGKTAFMKRTVHGIFSIHYKTTVGVDFALKVFPNNTVSHRFQFWDISGQERYGNMTRVYYQDSTGCFILMDCTRPSSWEGALKWLLDFETKTDLSEKLPCYLLITKMDLLSDEDPNVDLENWLEQHQSKFSKVFRISSHSVDLNAVSFDNIIKEMGFDLEKLYAEKILPKPDKLKEDYPKEPKKVQEEGFFQKIGFPLNLFSSDSKPIEIKKPDEKPILCFSAKEMRRIGTQRLIENIVTEISRHSDKMEYTHPQRGLPSEVTDVVKNYFTDLNYMCSIMDGHLHIRW